MTHEEKKTFIHNIFRLIVGIILLSTCFLYLRQNPAEKIALYSGFELIFQKIEVFMYNLVGKNWDIIDQKYRLEDQYLELIYLAEQKGCSDTAFLAELHQSYAQLLEESKSDIEQYIGRYRILGSEFQNRIEADSCYESQI